VIVDVAEQQIYRPQDVKAKKARGAGGTMRRDDGKDDDATKQIAHYQLESAFGGGSIDITGVVVSVDKAGVAVVRVTDFTVNKKKKAGSFKGCL
jgi:hypothetical protein